MKRAKTLPRALALMMSAVLLFSLVVGALPTLAATGTTYYVAADGTGNGSSAANPMSYAQANKTTLTGGDKLLFKRGDTFYGEFKPIVSGTSDESRVEIGAYGSGALPIISGAKIISSAWTDNDGDGFYKFDLTADGTYAGVQDNNANVGFFTDAKGNYYGRRFATAEKCTQQYDFYCDETAIYVKSDSDPYTALGTLKLATHELGLKLNKGLNIHDLHIEYFGNGMDWGVNDASEIGKYVRIYDCIIENIGGIVGSTGVDEEGNPTITRVGNAISLWDAGEDIVIENNILRNTYDVAFTAQGNNSGDNYNYWKNIVLRNNIIAYCTQAIEIFSGATGYGSGIEGMEFTDNLCIKNGEGWGSHMRGTQSCDFLTYGFTADIWQMNVENNTFYHSEDTGSVYNLSPTSMEKLFWGVTIDNNTVYQVSEESNYLYNRPADIAGGPEKYADKQLNLAEWQEFSGKDKNSSVTYIGDNLADYTAMEMVARTSLDYDEIARTAAAAGLEFSLTYDGNILAGNSDLQVSQKYITHTLDWSVDYPEYAFTAMTNPSSTYTDPQENCLLQLTDGDINTVTTNKNNAHYGVNIGNAMLSKRYALLYDLGARYELSQVQLHIDNTSGRYVYNYSVYAGNTADGLLLTNCVGRGGGTAAIESAMLNCTDSVRYVLIVFDHVGADPGNTNDATTGYSETLNTASAKAGCSWANGQINLKEIEVFGQITDLAAPSNVIAGSTNVTQKLIAHTLDWSVEYPEYAAESMTDIQSSVTATDMALAALTNGIKDNNTTSGNQVGLFSPGQSQNVLALNYRYALLYDLGVKHDLSSMSIYTHSSNGPGRCVYNYSVYAGNTPDGTLLENCVGRASRGSTVLPTTDETVSALIAGAGSARYVLVVFDHVGADPGNSRDTYDYGKTISTTTLPGCALADGQIRLFEIEINGVAVETADDGEVEEDPTADHTNILTAESVSVEQKLIRHDLDWSVDYPTYSATNLVAGTGIFTDNATALKATMDGVKNTIVGLFTGISGDTSVALDYRYALIYDLGAQYDLSKVTLFTNSSNANRYFYNFSVYAGNTNDGLLLHNCVGRGGGTDEILSADLSNAGNVRYIMFVFDHMGTDPGVANDMHITGQYDAAPYTKEISTTTKTGCYVTNGQIRLYEIEAYGEASTGSAPTNVIAGSTNGSTKLIKHALDWSVEYPEYAASSLIDGTGIYEVTAPAVLTDGVTDSSSNFSGIFGSDLGDKCLALNYRVALLYDLGAQYDLSSMKIYTDSSSADRYMYNYSVYAGNSADGLLLENCVGRGARGRYDDTNVAETISAYIGDADNVRYVLIVFDHMGTDPGNASDTQTYTNEISRSTTHVGCYYADGQVRMREIEIMGIPSTGKAVTNVLANNPDVKAAAKYIAHDLDWTVAYPDYSGKVLNTCVDGAVTSVLYDGDTADYARLNNNNATYTEGLDQVSWSNRYALLFDLGGQYDLSHIKLLLDNGSGRYLYNYSVYAGNTPDSRLLSNCVGQGGGKTTEESALLNNVTDVRYLLIVFDHLGTDPGNASDKGEDSKGVAYDYTSYGNGSAGCTWANGQVNIKEIELYGAALGNSRKLMLAEGLTSADVALKLNVNGLVTVDVVKANSWLKAGSLTYTVNDKTYPIVNRVGAYTDGEFNFDSETNSTSFFFSMPESGEVVVSAEFVDEGAANIAVLSTQISANYKMRFRSRVYQTYTVDDVVYDLKEAGTLMVNKATNSVNTTIEDGAALSDADLQALYNGADGVKKVVAKNGLVDRCDEYLDYVCAINFSSASSSYLDTEYCAIAYAVYTDGASDVIVYSAAAVNSYNGVIAALAAL